MQVSKPLCSCVDDNYSFGLCLNAPRKNYGQHGSSIADLWAYGCVTQSTVMGRQQVFLLQESGGKCKAWLQGSTARAPTMKSITEGEARKREVHKHMHTDNSAPSQRFHLPTG
eukprot:6479430-Amphidinium_carterae.1